MTSMSVVMLVNVAIMANVAVGIPTIQQYTVAEDNTKMSWDSKIWIIVIKYK